MPRSRNSDPPDLRLRRTFGANVRRLRRDRNLTQQQLAAIAGGDTSRISEIERGIYNPRLDTISRLADALQVSPADLLRPRIAEVSMKLAADRKK